MELIEVAKRAWMQPEAPMNVRVRPASSVGLVLARVKCNLGLALVASGLGHLSSLHPTRQVGESALSVVTEKLSTVPNNSFVKTMNGPRFYAHEVLLVLLTIAVFVLAAWCFLAAADIVEPGPSYIIREHFTKPLERML